MRRLRGIADDDLRDNSSHRDSRARTPPPPLPRADAHVSLLHILQRRIACNRQRQSSMSASGKRNTECMSASSKRNTESRRIIVSIQLNDR